MPEPKITVVVAAYQAERWIGEALDSILGQSRPPDEVIVVDDGSTDGTAAALAAYGDRITVIRQANGGCPAAFNTAIAAAHGDYVALCGADDVWLPEKLRRQAEAIAAHPEADLLFGHSVMFGRIEGEHERPPGSGMLDNDSFREALVRGNCVCAPSVVIRRATFLALGPFVEQFGADDYEYWFRCLRAGARFYYDPEVLLRYRQHDSNLSARRAWMDQCCEEVISRYEADVRNRAVVHEALGPMLMRIARHHVDEGRPAQARRAYLRSLRHAPGNSLQGNLRAIAWLGVLGLPAGPRERAGRGMVRVSRAAAQR